MISPELYSFSRNPILFQWEGSISHDPEIEAGTFYVEYNGKRIYDGRFTPPATINLAEMVDAGVEWIREPPVGNNAPLVQIEDSGDLANRKLYAFFEYCYSDAELERIVIPGGVSRQNFRQLANLKTDIFACRFMNPACNFFMTVRTAGWCICIRETELYPLYFFSLQTGDLYEFVDACTGERISDDTMDEGICALDIDALRKLFYEKHGIIPSVIDVYCNRVYASRIVIVQCDAAKERYRLKFRTSLGVFEIMEAVGTMSVADEYPDGEDSVYKRYDPVIDDFYNERSRIERRQILSVSTGVKRSEEMRLLSDLIASEEVYLLDWKSYPVKVIPTIEDLTYNNRSEQPMSFMLKLEVAEPEISIMQDINDGLESVRPRIFSSHFDAKI